MDSQNEHEQFNAEWYDLLASMAVMIAVIILLPLINRNIEDFNISFLDPASYSIVMKNLPMNVTKDDIINFFHPILKDKVNKKDKEPV